MEWYIAIFLTSWLLLGAVNAYWFATSGLFRRRFTWFRAIVLILSGPIPYLRSLFNK